MMLAMMLLLFQSHLETGMRQLLAAGGPAWAAYIVASEPGNYGGWCPADVKHLEPQRRMAVLYRIENGRIAKVRVESAECKLDPDGVPMHWIQNVTPAQSIALLTSSLVGPSDGVISAIAFHDDPAALESLLSMAKTGDARVRGKALFWLAHKAGKRAVGAISEAVERDPDTEVKRKAVFALSQLPHGEGVPMLIQLARTNSNPAVKKQAIFWLGQSKDPRALEFFEQILR